MPKVSNSDARTARAALAAHFAKHAGSRRGQHDDLIQGALTNAFSSWKGDVPFPAYAIACAKNVLRGQSRSDRRAHAGSDIADADAVEATGAERRAFTGKARKTRLPAGYDRMPGGKVIKGAFEPLPSPTMHPDGTRTAGTIRLPRGKRDHSFRKLTGAEKDAVVELANLLPFTVVTTRDGHEGAAVDMVTQDVWKRVERAFKGAFGCSIADAAWHRVGNRIAETVERLLVESIEEGADAEPRQLRRSTGVRAVWFDDGAATRILAVAQLGRGGGKRHEGERAVPTAVLREVNRARLAIGLKKLRKLLPL